MTTGELAHLSGVTVRAIRHYEKLGLISPSARKLNGYRSFDRQALTRVRLIAWFQTFGLSLREIQLIIERPEQTLSSLLERRLLEIETELETLKQTKKRLKQWSKRLYEGPLEEEPLYQLTEAIMSLEKHFTQTNIEEMNHRHDQISKQEQEEARRQLEEIVAEGRGVDLRSLVERYLGAEGTAKAFSSVEALKTVLEQHQISASSRQL